MEAVAMDKLIEKGDLSPQVALAIAEALDITIKAANLATVPMLDARFAQKDAKMEARFAQQEVKMEARFGSIEKSLMAQVEARTDAHFAKEEARTDRLFAEDHARTDRLVAELRAGAKQAEVRMDVKLDQLRALLINGSRKPDR
jgi:hypothetical protein